MGSLRLLGLRCGPTGPFAAMLSESATRGSLAACAAGGGRLRGRAYRDRWGES